MLSLLTAAAESAGEKDVLDVQKLAQQARYRETMFMFLAPINIPIKVIHFLFSHASMWKYGSQYLFSSLDVLCTFVLQFSCVNLIFLSVHACKSVCMSYFAKAFSECICLLAALGILCWCGSCLRSRCASALCCFQVCKRTYIHALSCLLFAHRSRFFAYLPHLCNAAGTNRLIYTMPLQVRSVYSPHKHAQPALIHAHLKVA